jgi:hypothetical protein
MHELHSSRIRLGAVTLASSAFLLALFPLIRPFGVGGIPLTWAMWLRA